MSNTFYFDSEAEIEQLKDGDYSLSSSSSSASIDDSQSNQFGELANTISRKLSLRSSPSELAAKNIIKRMLEEEDLNPIEKTSSVLNRRLSFRPSATDLLLRNILKDNNPSTTASLSSLSFNARAETLKSCLKKRPDPSALKEAHILPSNASVPSLLSSQEQSHSRSKSNLNFNETVSVYSTFKKTEYNRKPDDQATFRKLTPALKIQIREELNSYKKNEMEVHEESTHNTCFH